MEENQNQQLENLAPEVLQSTQTPPLPNIHQPGGKFKLSIKAIIGIIIFLLLAGGAAASFTVLKPQIMKLVSKPTPSPSPIIQTSPTPTPDPTANWKTYSSSKFLYALKYPSDLELQQLDTNDADYEILDFSEASKESGINVPPIIINIYGSNIKNAAYLVQNRQDDEKLLTIKKGEKMQIIGTLFERISDINIDNTTAAVYIGTAVKGYPAEVLPFEKRIIFIKDNNLYALSTAPMSGKKTDKRVSDFDQILSTFKFTEPTLTPSISQTANLLPQDIGLTAQLDASKNNVVITITKTELLKSFDYELDYDSLVDGSYVPRGVIGSTQTLQDNASFTRQVVLGTCAGGGGTCKYDKEVKNIYLTLSYTLKGGNNGVMKVAIPSD